MSLKEVLAQQKADRDFSTNLANQYGQAKLKGQEKRSDETLKALQDFSKTLQKKIITDEGERIQKAVKEGKINVHEKQLEAIEETGSDDIPQEEKDETEAVSQGISASKKAFDQAALNIQERDGRYEDAYSVKSLSGWRVWSERNETAAIAGKNYASWLEGEMKQNGDLELRDTSGTPFTPAEANTLEQKRIAMKALRIQFMEQQGLIGMDRTILSEKFYQPAVEAHRTLATQYEKEDRITSSMQERDDAKRYYDSSKDDVGSFGKLLDTLASTVDDKDNRRNRAGALDEAFNIIIELADVGEFDKIDDYKKLGEQEVTVNGVTKKVKDMWPYRYKKLYEDLHKEDKENFDMSEENKELDFKKAEQEKIELIEKALEEDPDSVDNKFLTRLKTDLESAHIGFKSTKLDTYIKNAAPDAKALLAQEAEIKDLISKSLLTDDVLNNFDARLRKKYKDEAKIISAAVSKENKADTDFLETRVSTLANASKLDKDDATVEPMKAYLVALYRKELAKGILGGIENPSQFAREQANAWFDKFIADPNNLTEDGYVVPGFSITPAELSQQREQVQKEIQRINKVIKNNPAAKLFQPEHIGKLISKDKALKAYLDHQNDPNGWDYPKEVQALYNVYGKKGLSKYDIWQDILGAHQIGKFQPSPADDKASQTTDKGDMTSLLQGSPEASVRFLSKVGRVSGLPNIEYVPNGEGENAFKWSEENGIDFGKTASIYEALISNPSLAKQFDIFEDDLSPDGEGVNWEKAGVAISMLGNHITTKLTPLMESIEDFGEWLAPSPENSANPSVRSGELRPLNEMPSNNPNLRTKVTSDGVTVLDTDRKSDPTGDIGYQSGQAIVQGISDMVDWTEDQINAWLDSIVDDDMVSDITKSQYKYDPSPENLSYLIRK